MRDYLKSTENLYFFEEMQKAVCSREVDPMNEVITENNRRQQEED